MSTAAWDVRHVPSFAGDRDLVVAELKRRDALRNRERESPTQRERPTFVVRAAGTGGAKLSSWADGTARHVPITVKDGAYSIPNGTNARSLEELLVKLGYIDDDDDEEPSFQYVALGNAVAAAEAQYDEPPCAYAPAAPFQSLRQPWQIAAAELTLEPAPMASGAFGQVFKGQLKSGELVAVKVCKATAAAALAPKAQSDFVNELAILRSLRAHDNVVQFFGAVLDARGAPVRLVLQFCSGGSLLEAIESAAWVTWRTATKVRLLAGVARGLEHLHASGVVHRDLAARNVLLETAASGELIAKVADFGMARAVDDADVGAKTVSGIGPFAWMAPEQFHRLQYSAASDAFAFGVVAFELFTRKTPWKGVSKDAVCGRVLSGERLSFGRCKIPAELERLVVQHCWAEDPAHRPSLAQVRQACESLAQQLK
jgi:tRNA A-37 threonylcarbamoyl transferase component Bud32